MLKTQARLPPYLIVTVQEVTHSALKAARLFWPNVFENVTGEKLQRVEDGMSAVRPVLVKGFEAVIMVCLKEHVIT